ncbi:MarR family winged helix-turn-helix transcriptional regulator [Xanthovirga aplysinae]|uniref:MarR family winged helix-turn-helix transcriptional regulator n=1 Tax=Xanthovirga aplysinae TaxID=2529853 RepID=UPI0012BBE652|nr:MarR family transcriptional regulator [Xanthovirga aplysinae]MTI31373.1 MarR family transcriptional regulator [Xanthovirga aplysinae]
MKFDYTLTPWIGKTAKMISLYFSDKLQSRGIDLTKTQCILLKILHDKDGVPQNELAFITERDKTSLTRLVNTMEKKNLLERVPSEEDKRVNLVYLTEEGRKIFERALPVIKEIVEELQKGISEEEVNYAIGIIKKVQNNIKINHPEFSIN